MNMAVKLHQRTAGPPEKVRLPVSHRVLGFALAGALAVVAGIFAIFYVALSSQYDPLGEGLAAEEVVSPAEIEARPAAE